MYMYMTKCFIELKIKLTDYTMSTIYLEFKLQYRCKLCIKGEKNGSAMHSKVRDF